LTSRLDPPEECAQVTKEEVASKIALILTKVSMSDFSRLSPYTALVDELMKWHEELLRK
jgi:hypothetical protein